MKPVGARGRGCLLARARPTVEPWGFVACCRKRRSVVGLRYGSATGAGGAAARSAMAALWEPRAALRWFFCLSSHPIPAAMWPFGVGPALMGARDFPWHLSACPASCCLRHARPGRSLGAEPPSAAVLGQSVEMRRAKGVCPGGLCAVLGLWGCFLWLKAGGCRGLAIVGFCKMFFTSLFLSIECFGVRLKHADALFGLEKKGSGETSLWASCTWREHVNRRGCDFLCGL